MTEFTITRPNTKPDPTSGMVRLLSIGDPHFRIDNLEEVQCFINNLVGLVHSEKPDAIVVMGDLLHDHERLNTTVVNRAYEFINQMRALCPVYVLVGNHDYINNSQFMSTNHWMNALKEWKDVYIIDKTYTLTHDNIRILMLPYVSAGRFEEALGDDWNWKDDVSAIFCHQEFKGCRMGAIVSEHGDEWNSNYPPIVSGHIHERQMIGDNVYYPGSCMQHAFGESANKSIAMCVIRSNSMHVTEHTFDMPSKHIVYVNMDELKNYNIKDIDTKDRYRLTVQGPLEEFNQFKKSTKYKDLIKQGVKIAYRTNKKNDDVNKLEKQGSDNFTTILEDLIKQSNNKTIETIYRAII
jgi:DNA repair exonuclease SbcCD nuclease subunit